MFGENSSVRTVEITDQKAIRSNTFNGSLRIQQITLGSGVKKIYGSPFKTTLVRTMQDLQSINISNSAITEIKKHTFKGCDNIMVYYPSRLEEFVEYIPGYTGE